MLSRRGIMFDIVISQKPLFGEVIFNAVILLLEFLIASHQEILILVGLQSILEILHCTFFYGCSLFGPQETISVERLHLLALRTWGKFFPKSNLGNPRIAAIIVLPWLSLVVIVYH